MDDTGSQGNRGRGRYRGGRSRGGRWVVRGASHSVGEPPRQLRINPVPPHPLNSGASSAANSSSQGQAAAGPHQQTAAATHVVAPTSPQHAAPAAPLAPRQGPQEMPPHQANQLPGQPLGPQGNNAGNQHAVPQQAAQVGQPNGGQQHPGHGGDPQQQAQAAEQVQMEPPAGSQAAFPPPPPVFGQNYFQPGGIAAPVGNGLPPFGPAGRGNAGGGRGRGQNGPHLAGFFPAAGRGRGVVPVHASIDALLASPARLNQPRLHPQRENNAMWFGVDPTPRQVVVASIRRHFDGPWYNISSVSNDTLIQWWGQFIQAFYWEPQHGPIVYSYWYALTSNRLRDMVSKAKNSGNRPHWISEDIWSTMWAYWNSPEGKRRSRIAANNRMSDRDGFGPHAHRAGSRTYERLRHLIREREGVEPSMLRLLRETHMRADGTFVDGRAAYIDAEVQRQIDAASQPTVDGSEQTTLTQLQQDVLYLQVVAPSTDGRLFGVGGQQPIRERGESSSQAAGRLSLQRQVTTIQNQLRIVLEFMNQLVQNEADSNSPNNGTTGSATRSHRNITAEELQASLAAAEVLVNVARGQPRQGVRAVAEEPQADDPEDGYLSDDEEGEEDDDPEGDIFADA